MKDDGGPAYPINPDTNIDHTGQIYPEACGKSLRDWFAGKALPQVIAQCRGDDRDATPYPDYVAKRCYELADAMLAERKK